MGNSFLVLRHGERAEDGVHLGPHGYQQAYAFTRHWLGKDQPKPKILVSPQLRAYETGQELAQLMNWDLPEIVRELDAIMGDAERDGQVTELYTNMKEYIRSTWTSVEQALLAVPGGVEYMRKKVRALHEFVAKTSGDDVVLVGHENTVGPLIWDAMGVPYGAELPGGQIRYMEGALIITGSDVRILRNPYYE